MNFRTNFGKLALLGNIPIKIYFPDKTVEFVPPNITTYLLDETFLSFLYYIKLTPSDFKALVAKPDFIIENKYEVLLTYLKSGVGVQDTLNYFKQIFPNLEYKSSQFYCGDKALNFEEYDIILRMLSISCAEEEIEPFLKNLETSAQEPKELSVSQKRMKEVQDKIKAAKEKGKNKNKKEDKSNGSTITIDQIVIGILYEFSSLKLEEIYKMNMYTLLFFWKFVSKVVDTQIQIVAAGNGHIKEFTYFIN
jgi:hypothetical protein